MPKNDEQIPTEGEAQFQAFQDELNSLLRRHKNQAIQSELLATFKGSASVNARKLSVFLDLFTIAYNVSLVAFNYARESDEPIAVTGELIYRALMDVSNLEENGEFAELEIERISFQSRLGITFSGSTTALTLAVILSGGEMEEEHRGLNAKMPSLAEGIAALKHALND